MLVLCNIPIILIKVKVNVQINAQKTSSNHLLLKYVLNVNLIAWNANKLPQNAHHAQLELILLSKIIRVSDKH